MIRKADTRWVDEERNKSLIEPDTSIKRFNPFGNPDDIRKIKQEEQQGVGIKLVVVPINKFISWCPLCGIRFEALSRKILGSALKEHLRKVHLNKRIKIIPTSNNFTRGEIVLAENPFDPCNKNPFTCHFGCPENKVMAGYGKYLIFCRHPEKIFRVISSGEHCTDCEFYRQKEEQCPEKP